MYEDLINEHGFTIIDFINLNYLHAIQAIVKQVFTECPTELHTRQIEENQYLSLVKQAKDHIVRSGFVKHLLLANADLFIKLLGPDIDMQSDLHLRISRPHSENDLVDWHRDTFNGNSYWEINLWFPVFPLEEGAGLSIIEASHQMPSNNIRYIEEKNPFRSKVTKGSIANELGYLYAPKTDDVIFNRNENQIKLLTPNLGQFILFFGYLAHRPQNLSSRTRISIDLRLRNMFAPTNTKAGYYQPLTRGVIANCVEKMVTINANSNPFNFKEDSHYENKSRDSC